MDTLNIALAQINPTVGDLQGNAEQIIQISNNSNADLVIFPELALCGYPPEDLLLRPYFYHHCQAALTHIIEQIQPAIILGLPTSDGTNHYNKALFIDSGKIIGDYAKQHLPNYTVFDEKRYFTAGNSPAVIDFKGISIGLLICEDLWQPEPIAACKKAGANLVVCINASPFSRGKLQKRQSILQQRSHEQNISIIYANLAGAQDELVFDGGSMVVNNNGEVQQTARCFSQEIMSIVVNTEPQPQSVAKEIAPWPDDISSVYQALVLGVKDYIEKNNFPGALIGLSGGIDSALTLAIAHDAIGAERLQVLLMPSRYTADMSNNDAANMATQLNVNYHIISIEPIFTRYLNTLEPLFKHYEPNSAEENIQARIRGNLLMALSNKFGKIVLTTGNKSELAVGYCTLYGDMSGGFAVLKDVPKTLVYKLARYRNQQGPCIPHNIITRPPTAELRDNQCDQDSLPPYDVLDQIIELYINQDRSSDDIVKTGISRDIVDTVVNLIKRNEYKRRQAPIGIRISERAFGRDRRYPITSKYSG